MNKTPSELVLLPGLDGTGLLFTNFLAALATERVITIVKYPNEPLGYDELYQTITEHLPADRPYVLLAESFSGPLAIRLAASNPPFLRGLILCASFLRNPLKWHHRMAFALMQHCMPVFRQPPRWCVRRYLLGVSASEQMVDSFLETIRPIKPAVIASRIRSVAGCDVREAFTLVAAPTLYLRAVNDNLLRNRVCAEIRQARPNTEIKAIHTGHLVLQDNPHACAAIVNRFLDDISNNRVF